MLNLARRLGVTEIKTDGSSHYVTSLFA
jgi:hypothetical protein